MSDYASPLTYQCYDFYSGAYLGTIPFASVTFSSQLNQPGQFSGQIDISSEAVQALAPVNSSQPARTCLCIDYNGALIWGGIVWPRNYSFDAKNRMLTVTASEIWSYFSQRVQATDYSSPPASGATTNMPIWNAANLSDLGQPYVWDPMLISGQILSDALSLNYGDPLGMGIAYNSYTSVASYLASGTQTPSGDYLSVSYPLSSPQQINTMVSQLASNGLDVGFDYGVDVAYSAGYASTPIATINLSYPYRGRTPGANGLVINCGSAISYQVPEDGSQTGNIVFETGASGSLVVAENIYPLEQGYARLEQVKSRANIQSANLLNVLSFLGVSDLYQLSYAVTTPSVTMDLFGPNPQLGQFIVGDQVRWIIPATDGDGNMYDPRFPNGLDETWRITGYSATVGDSGMSTIQFNLAQPPATIADTTPV